MKGKTKKKIIITKKKGEKNREKEYIPGSDHTLASLFLSVLYPVAQTRKKEVKNK